MAEVSSLGVHVPAALPYLVAEGILPKEPKRDLYQWQTYAVHESGGHLEEEVLTTKDCVIWSQGRFIRNVYRLGLEGEEVVQALLTQFPTTTAIQPEDTRSSNEHNAVHSSSRRRSPSATATGLRSGNSQSTPTENLDSTPARALVIFLKSKAHIHFLDGAHHIINLPFEVRKAFPAPRGVILQRTLSLQATLPQTPHVPGAPPNSFYSSQSQPLSSFLQAPALGRVREIDLRRSGLSGGDKQHGHDFVDGFGSPEMRTEEDGAPFYSLTSPTSEVGVITYSLQHQKPRLSSKSQTGLSVTFEGLDAGEDLIYVSTNDELGNCRRDNCGPLNIIVTANSDLRTLTIWHAWYVSERSLSSLMTQRVAQKAAKARRRSSFLSATMVTGAATPAVRHRDVTRDSMPGASSVRLPGEPAGVNPDAASSRKPTRQEEEDAMASQMDPDYQPAVSQHSTRESRRISSLNADVRTGPSNINASFGVSGARRNTSFGGPNERRSFGHRKSRASTPGSVANQVLGLDDDLMEVDSMPESDRDENTENVVRHVRATYEAAGADSIFGNFDGGFKRDLVVRKLHAMPMTPNSIEAESTNRGIRVVCLKGTQHDCGSDGQKLNIYVHGVSATHLACLKLQIRHRALWPELASSPHIAVPTVTGEVKLGYCADIAKLRDRGAEALYMGTGGLVLSIDGNTLCPLPTPAPYRMYNAFNVSILPAFRDEDIGRNRTLLGPPHDTLQIVHPGLDGSFDEVDTDGIHHRRQMKLKPEDATVAQLLEVSQLVLPIFQSNSVLGIWQMSHASLVKKPASLQGTAESLEWVALAATVLGFGLHLVDAKARAALNITRVAAGNQHLSRTGALHLQKQHHALQVAKEHTWAWLDERRPPSSGTVKVSPITMPNQTAQKDQLFVIAAALADDMARSALYGAYANNVPTLSTEDTVRLMLALHVFNEERKLYMVSPRVPALVGLIAQLGSWLCLPAWSYQSTMYYSLQGVHDETWSYVKSNARHLPQMPMMDAPIGVFHWLEHAHHIHSTERYPTLDVIAALDSQTPLSKESQESAKGLTPRIAALSDILAATAGLTASAITIIESMAHHGLTHEIMETLPEAVAAPFREAIATCEKEPPTTWSTVLLDLVGRNDLDMDVTDEPMAKLRGQIGAAAVATTAPRDVQTVCNALDQHSHSHRTKEADRHAVSQLLFNEDRRLVDATALMHFSSVQSAECAKQPDWSDMHHLEQQRKMMQWITVRMIALPAGDAMIHFDSQVPLLTDKYHLSGFSSSCVMQPMGHTMTTDRSGLTEEKVNWAYFHAGVSAGLRISRNVQGIDTSWIAFNKPNDLTNRHAGLLLALGLGGHLRHLAKWLSFKYLTPKHTMTSVGLLLGLSASYMGSMDGLITRMLSVHITRMLPPGAAELNVSHVTQTAGLMGIGLLFYNTQHRRMSEIMLSEVEHMEVDDPDSSPDPLRDESYRLAAGFALGLINLGKGQNLRGLHGMYLPERLLAVAVGPRPVNAVHIFDKATAGAIVAIALVYMKSGDKTVARKIDIPDTEIQFDHVRPDMLMLRAMAKHIILWDSIEVNESAPGATGWTQANLPECYKNYFQRAKTTFGRHAPTSSDVPFFNITTGLVWALSLKYAGSGNTHARDEILTVLDYFYTIKGGSDSYYYDAKLARSTVRRCIDVLALSAATVMAGTGDIRTFRYLRRLHGRTDSETPYGSHLAAHLAIGVLFLGGGTYTFGTSDLAIAALICAFYPLFPTDVHDNHVHLQAFRHFWVFATEARCLVVEDVETHRPIPMPIIVSMKDGSTNTLTAPSLLPELGRIATVQTNDPTYWRVTLDFVGNPKHLSAFRRHQKIFVRRCPVSEAHSSVFASTLAAMTDAQCSGTGSLTWQSIFNLPILKDFDKADNELVLPPNAHGSVYTDEHGTLVDAKLALRHAVTAWDGDALWNLRLLLAWAEKARREGVREPRWIGTEFIESLNAMIEERSRGTMVGGL